MSGPLRYDMGNVRGGQLLCYDAAAVEEDALMLSGPNTQAPSSSPPVSWGNPGESEGWDGPYGPPVTDWTDGSHGQPGSVGGSTSYSPPNKSWHWDSDVPQGWYTLITKQDRSRTREEVPTVSGPII